MHFKTPLCVAFLFCLYAGVAGVADSASASEAADTQAFDQAVGSFLKQHCVSCHGETRHEGDFRVDNLSRDVGGGPDAGRWAEVIEKINNGEMPPRDQPNLPTAEQGGAVTQWLSDRIHEGEAARLARRGPVSFHRLTREEYANTVYDLLGVRFDATDPTGLTEDSEWKGFERIGSVLSLSASHVEKYFHAAEMILAEAYPEKQTEFSVSRKRALDLRGGPSPQQIQQLEEAGLADKVRVDMWPGHQIQGGRPGPGNQMFRTGGTFKVSIQVSGLKPAGGRAPHLSFYADKLDRMLFEQDIVAPEDKPIVVEFLTHLPAGGHTFVLSNDVPGPSILPRSGRAGRKPFFSLADGRIPWQLKLTDEAGVPLYPFLIVDWVQWEGPIITDEEQLRRDRFLPTDPEDLQQARERLQTFIEYAFRRPATQQQIQRFVGLLESEIEAGEKFFDAYRTCMLAVLCSSEFFYLIEGSPDIDRHELNDWELASRLSYMLWATMPDDELMQLADKGHLRDPEVLRSQLARMLEDPRARRFSDSFARQWLQLKKVGMFPPDSKLYPEYDKYLEKSMVEETVAFFDHVLQQNLTLREFIDSQWTMLNPRLAMHYGIDGVKTDRMQLVTLKPDDHRGGILTHASVLSLTSDGTRHRPVHRGVWVMESILGKSPPPPPANVEPIEPNPVDSPKATIRMKLDAHKHDANCAACHRKIDPLGFAFDNFDAIGRWRTEEVVQAGTGSNPKVDASGTLADGRTFADVREFQQLLLSDLETFNTTFVEKLATFSMRRTMTIDDKQAIARIAETGKQNDYRLRDLVEAFVLSDLFQQR